MLTVRGSRICVSFFTAKLTSSAHESYTQSGAPAQIISKDSGFMKRPRWIETLFLMMLLLPQGIGAVERVRVHAPARTFVQFPFWVGIDKKFYDAQGLHVEPIVMATPIAIAALSKGEIDFLTTGDSAGNAIIRGFKFKIIFVYGARNLFSLMATPDIKRAEDLRGKKVGVTSYGGTSFFSAQMALVSLGLEIGRDVTIVPVGGGTARMLAMETRAISAAPLTPPDTEMVKERFGAWPIVSNESEIFSSLPTASGLTTSEAILQSKPELVKKMVQATITSVRYVNDERNEDELVRYIQESWKVSRAAAAGSLRSVRKLFEPKGIPSDAALKEILRLQRARYEIKREIKPDELFDFTVARNLQAK
jgi:ABC-type nitrate/sulfonate/bicarbonate transport system substrate-binding protein